MRSGIPHTAVQLVLGILVSVLLLSCDSAPQADVEVEEVPSDPVCDVIAEDVVEPDSLAALYTFDTDFLDHSGNCRHGEPGGFPEFVDGLAGQAIELDGLRDFVMIPAEQSALPSTRATVIILVKLLHFRRAPEVLASWTGGCLYYLQSTTSAGTKPGFGSCYDNSQTGLNDVVGKWIMITARSEAWSQNENNFRFRVIGADYNDWRNRWESSAGEIIGNREIFLGTRNSGKSEDEERFEGVIDEVRIYNRHLTAEEEKRIFDFYAQFSGDG